MLKKLGIVSGLFLVALALMAPLSMAQVWNRKTVVTVSEPLVLPGVTLQPGTYVFKLADSLSNRHIVQVFNDDESQILATIMAIPNYRLEPTGKTELDLWETPRGTPKALRAWFYPGDNFGQEFMYPKTQAAALSAEVHQEVPAVPEQPETTQPEQQARTEPPPAPEAQTAPAPETQAPPAPAPETQAPAPAQPEQHAALPHTASVLPLTGLTGLLVLGVAVVIRFSRLS